MLPLSQASDRLPLWGSWQSQQALTERVVLLLDIQFGRHVELVRDVLAVLFALTHTLGEQILDLPVHRAEVILSPCGKGIVEIHGTPCPVLGRVCMDQMMVDVTDVPEVREDDEAILWGGTVSDTAETIARKTDTIPYEVLCGVSRRVPRVYRDHGQIVAVEDWILEA